MALHSHNQQPLPVDCHTYSFLMGNLWCCHYYSLKGNHRVAAAVGIAEINRRYNMIIVIISHWIHQLHTATVPMTMLRRQTIWAPSRCPALNHTVFFKWQLFLHSCPSLYWQFSSQVINFSSNFCPTLSFHASEANVEVQWNYLNQTCNTSIIKSSS